MYNFKKDYGRMLYIREIQYLLGGLLWIWMT